jgi:hypothetical protein
MANGRTTFVLVLLFLVFLHHLGYQVCQRLGRLHLEYQLLVWLLAVQRHLHRRHRLVRHPLKHRMVHL